MNQSSRPLTLAACLLLTTAIQAHPLADETVWTFDNDTPGQTAPGFEPCVGTWEVDNLDDGAGRVLVQKAKSAKPVYNVALVHDRQARDVDLSVRFRALDGEIDQGGGLVWRARDARNYYIARYNPLEDNLRVYKVVDGTRSELQNADIPRRPGWHTLRAVMIGDRIRIDLDGEPYLTVDDPTFPDAGRVGLWSKADARTQFDDLTLRTLRTGQP